MSIVHTSKDSPSTQDLRINADQRIAVDLTCAGCGYNLKLSAIAAACPECGTPIQCSLAADRICFNHPELLSFLRRGATCVFAAFLLDSILGLVMLTRYLLYAVAGPILTGFEYWNEWFSQILWIALCYTGFWLLTAPEPGQPLWRGWSDIRWVIRVALGISLLKELVHFSMISLALVNDYGLAWLVLILNRLDYHWLFQLADFVASHVGIVVGCYFLAGLAERLPNRRLTTGFVWLMLGWLANALLYEGVMLRCIPESYWMPGTATETVLTPLAWGFWVAALGMTMWMAIALFVLRKQLIEAIPIARITWTGPPYRPAELRTIGRRILNFLQAVPYASVKSGSAQIDNEPQR